jgi:pantoate--beta-alanine ligase
VATVCNKLFNIVSPERAYFGQKDAQQVAVLKTMVRDLDMNLELIVLPTVREADGVAMSSRNAYLRPDERVAARVLHRALTQAREMQESGVSDADAIRKQMASVVEAEPLAVLEYATVVDPLTFEELDTLQGPALGVITVRIGTTRLIDNMPLG